MSALPTYVALDLVADLIPIGRKTLRNMKCQGTIDFLHHIDDRGNYSHKLLVYLPGLIAFAIERGLPQVVKWLIERTAPRTRSVRDVLRQLLVEEECRVS